MNRHATLLHRPRDDEIESRTNYGGKVGRTNNHSLDTRQASQAVLPDAGQRLDMPRKPSQLPACCKRLGLRRIPTLTAAHAR